MSHDEEQSWDEYVKGLINQSFEMNYSDGAKPDKDDVRIEPVYAQVRKKRKGETKTLHEGEKTDSSRSSSDLVIDPNVITSQVVAKDQKVLTISSLKEWSIQEIRQEIEAEEEKNCWARCCCCINH